MRNKKDSILEILENSKGYDTALLTTFNFEVDFFEKAIMGRLIRNSIKKISLFVDARELEKAMQMVAACSIGQKYAVTPVFMSGSFHPKVILLLGEKKARVIVGSGNLKLSGYYINNEVFDYIDCDLDNQEHKNVIADAISFFQQLQQITPLLDADLIRSFRKRWYSKNTGRDSRIRFLQNDTVSILDQAALAISEDVKCISVASPYFDNDLRALKMLSAKYGNARIRLYLQKGTSTFLGNKKDYDAVRVFEDIETESNKNHHFYHGKVYLFECESRSYILFGSSNCTQSALTKSREEGGNYECNLLVSGKAGEFKPFFKQFKLIKGASPEGHRMTYDSQPAGNYYFKYGILDKSLRLCIGFIKPASNISIIYQNTRINFDVKGNEIIVETENDQFENVFELEIRYNNTSQVLKCWYVDKQSLELYRLQTFDENVLTDSEDYGVGDKYLEDYERILRADLQCRADMVNNIQLLNAISNQDSVDVNDITEEDSEEDFIINVTLDNATYESYRQYKAVEKIRGRLASRYLSSAPLYLSTKFLNNPTLTERIDTEQGEHRRKATTEEKRFERFVKRIVRNLSEEKNAEAIGTKNYLELVYILFDIIEKYNKEKVIGIFPDTYVVTAHCDLLLRLIPKLGEMDSEYRNKSITKVLDVLLYNHDLILRFETDEQRKKHEALNRRVLVLLDKQYAIRSNFIKYLLQLRSGTNVEEDTRKISNAGRYLDNLFGYKDISRLEDYVRRYHGTKSKFKMDGDLVVVTIYTNKIGNYYKPDISLLRELKNYSLKVSRISKVIIIVINNEQKRGGGIIRIDHMVDFEYRKWQYEITRGNGRTEKGVPKYIQF